jgi:putative FmdB family regulatory protein
MPTYEYECPDCEHAFELFQSISAKPVKVCPACKKRKVRRLIGAGAGLIFKGSGFYETDYRSEGYKKAADADKPSSSSSDKKGSDEKSGEKKAEKTEPKKKKPAKKD